MPLIQVKNLEKVYCDDGVKTRALDGISFEIKNGEFVAIMGPSGSGKSTLLHILGFLDKQTKGEYFFDGRSINQYSKNESARLRNEKIGFIFQAFNLLGRTTVLDNVKLPLLYSDVKPRLWDDLARRVLRQVNLSHRFEYKPSQLSGGEKQRLAIARALVNQPRVIFADEPTGNLDSKSGQNIIEILSQLHQRGQTIILITHDAAAAQFAQRIIKLKDGRLISDQKI